MERLTKHHADGTAIMKERGSWQSEGINRLAAYEDTGLEPEEITKAIGGKKAIFSLYSSVDQERVGHIRDLLKAEEEGRLVVLPAKTIFEPIWDAGDGCDLKCPEAFDQELGCEMCVHGKAAVYEHPCRQEHISRIGKTVFLTREEAEAALKKEMEHEGV